MYVKTVQVYNGLPCGRITEVQDGTAMELFERRIAVPLDHADREWVRQREEGRRRKRGRKAMAAPPVNKMVSPEAASVKEPFNDPNTTIEGVERPGGGVGD